MRKLIAVTIAAGSLALGLSGTAGAAAQEKVTICHVDPDTGVAETITIAAPAAAHHFAHHAGDTAGECPVV